jgi:hypothetical protein
VTEPSGLCGFGRARCGDAEQDGRHEAAPFPVRIEHPPEVRYASTIRRILQHHRIPPAPIRHTDTNWRRQLLRPQATSMLAVDFLHVDCGDATSALRPQVGDRYRHVLDVTGHPHGPGPSRPATCR